ncbi:Mitochondrial DNA replication protein YHM2 [Pestalotiopsis fici W106-1]|uniref:Mitochondrial DNA replication protein YHM2 n=1 Tax=Pestalotiopsis fici (strain W106-1 / CGMCC3.15140) TaxID=1229662 RepID=W3WSF4_PESFW|nr:Mitochondrial DNA replication protein YHM2 [Pestalotiopsis fici W106-1]ETS76102.1 Mitochondrial DNA replication protein YHM2 [Pestalotiopsis fici W106-1]
MTMSMKLEPVSAPLPGVPTKRQTPWSNLAVGAMIQIFQSSSLGQPFEVLKTHVAAHRSDTLREAIQKTWARGGIAGFYQGLIPWAWIEASTKGSTLILASAEAEYYSKTYLNASPGAGGVIGGVAGGAAQAYGSMGSTTCMKTIEVTRSKNVQLGVLDRSTTAIFADILKTQGIRGIYRGVNAVALRQITGWSSRMGISRFSEEKIRALRGKKKGQKTSFAEKILASSIGGALSCWNQPFEVLRVEMQSMTKDPKRPANMTMLSTAKYITQTSGPLGLFRGIVPRIAVGVWSTICMVGFGDMAKEAMASLNR